MTVLQLLSVPALRHTAWKQGPDHLNHHQSLYLNKLPYTINLIHSPGPSQHMAGCSSFLGLDKQPQAQLKAETILFNYCTAMLGK